MVLRVVFLLLYLLKVSGFVLFIEFIKDGLWGKRVLVVDREIDFNLGNKDM